MGIQRVKGDRPQESVTFCYRCQLDESQFEAFLPFVVEIAKINIDVAAGVHEEFCVVRINKLDKTIVEKTLKELNIDYKIAKP